MSDLSEQLGSLFRAQERVRSQAGKVQLQTDDGEWVAIDAGAGVRSEQVVRSRRTQPQQVVAFSQIWLLKVSSAFNVRVLYQQFSGTPRSFWRDVSPVFGGQSYPLSFLLRFQGLLIGIDVNGFIPEQYARRIVSSRSGQNWIGGDLPPTASFLELPNTSSNYVFVLSTRAAAGGGKFSI